MEFCLYFSHFFFIFMEENAKCVLYYLVVRSKRKKMSLTFCSTNIPEWANNKKIRKRNTIFITISFMNMSAPPLEYYAFISALGEIFRISFIIILSQCKCLSSFIFRDAIPASRCLRDSGTLLAVKQKTSAWPSREVSIPDVECARHVDSLPYASVMAFAA